MSRHLLILVLMLGNVALAQSPFVEARIIWRRHHGQPYPRHIRLYAQNPDDNLFVRNRSDTLATARRWQLYHPLGGDITFTAAGTAVGTLGQQRAQVVPDETGWELHSPGDTLYLLVLNPDSLDRPSGTQLVRRLRRGETIHDIPLLWVIPNGQPPLRWSVTETGALEDIPELFRVLALIVTIREQYLR
ncbi:MAG: hypothetical protein D6722_02600 [Bacteroidetes bacterium]|nr:MAG: hypothetical protein D6722_02600 [Bacteroidota bacterium]